MEDALMNITKEESENWFRSALENISEFMNVYEGKEQWNAHSIVSMILLISIYSGGAYILYFAISRLREINLILEFDHRINQYYLRRGHM